MKTSTNHIRKLLAMAAIIGLLFTACYEFDSVNQPHSADLNSTFDVKIRLTTTDGNSSLYVPYFGVLLPLGWTVEDSVPYNSSQGNSGAFIYSVQLSAEMDSIDPAPAGYYWWVSEGSDSVTYYNQDTYEIDPRITTGSQPGTYYLDYMLGPGEQGYYEFVKLNFRRSNDHIITVGLPDALVVTSAADNGPGSLRQAIDSIDFYGTITFAIGGEDTIMLEEQLMIQKDITLAGPDDDWISISGNHATRVFQIGAFAAPSLSNLRIINGQSNDGGGILWEGVTGLQLQNMKIAGNHADDDGGGIWMCYNAELVMNNVILSGNSANRGGGIFFSEQLGGGSRNWKDREPSQADFQNVIISNNLASGSGGGLSCYSSTNLSLQNVSITGNRTNGSGGGIYNNGSASFTFKDVDITKNVAVINGGGICSDLGNIQFDSLMRCNVYLNSAGTGNDLYSPSSFVEVIVDTFSVLNPTEFHAWPLSNFSFDILHGKMEQIEADLYVSPEGDDSASGLSEDDPLKTIWMARSKILADSLHPHTIHLLEGVYSPSANGEIFPVNMMDHVSLSGASRDQVILNAEGESGVIWARESSGFGISDLTITGGNSSSGGGIGMEYSTLSIQNVKVTGNRADGYGGGIYLGYYSQAEMKNVTVSDNSAQYGGGISFFYESTAVFDSLARCNIYLNSAQEGNDLSAIISAEVKVIVDTFSVLNPTVFHASPLVNFNFEILHGKIEQAAADLYVSPNGDDNNNGLIEQDPLKTIRMARLKILADSTDPHTIHLLEGTYSPSTNGEVFPLPMVNYVNLAGSSRSDVILDAEGTAGVINMTNCTHTDLSGMALTGGKSSQGGGITMASSSPVLHDLTISGNLSENYGGGIYMGNGCSPVLENIRISGNTSQNYGGGIYCGEEGSPEFKNVTVTNNTSTGSGGGLFFGYNVSPVFDASMRSNIYFNTALSTSEGNDLYASSNVEVIVDTFTVLYPKNFHAARLVYFSFDILHAMIPQQTIDLYVSTDGDDSHTGLAPEDPLKTINRALQITDEYSLNDLYAIHLANGIYSASATGETFPVTMDDYMVLSGESREGVVLDAEGISYPVIALYFRRSSAIRNLTVTGGQPGIYSYYSNPLLQNLTISGNHYNYGGGIYLYDSRAHLKELLVTNNTADISGGGIYCQASDPVMEQVTVKANHSLNSGGGGICLDQSDPLMQKVTISDNTAIDHGGGIRCYGSHPVLKEVMITNNSAEVNGGGIYFDMNSGARFDSTERCNIYFNQAKLGREIYSDAWVDVVVDTFTVMHPRPVLAWPPEHFSFDILHGMIPQVNADLFVAPDGDDTHTGLTEDDPLKTISRALLMILSDSTQSSTVHLARGTYSPSKTGETYPLWIPSYVALTGASESHTLLDAESTARIMELRYVQGTVVSDLTLQNGYDAQNGGGIYFYQAGGLLRNMRIRENVSGGNGGGISLFNGSDPRFIDVQFTGNRAVNRGGAIYCIQNSVPSIKNSVIEENLADYGGGAYCTKADPLLDSVTIKYNTAENSGGGICSNGSSLTLRNSTIDGNTAEMGGGIYCNSSQTKLENLTIQNNVALDYGGGINFTSSDPEIGTSRVTGNIAQYGGGIYCKSTDLRIENAVVSYNLAEKGGGFYFLQSDPVLVNVLLSDNAASDEGGGVRCSFSDLVLVNSTLTGNYAGNGGAISSSGSGIILNNDILWNDAAEEVWFTPQVNPCTLATSYSDIQGGVAGIITNDNGLINWKEGNIDNYPVFEGMGENPYALAAGSPCIDAGTADTTGLNLPPWDLLGNVRIWDGDGDGVALVDMGAYEAGAVIVGTDESAVGGQQSAVSVVPNPTVSRSEIKYQISKSKSVTLKVLDMHGSEICTLINQVQAPGEHVVSFDASSLPAGIYVVRLETEGAFANAKMVVMR